MVRKKTTVVAKTGTVSKGGMNYAPRNTTMAKSWNQYKNPQNYAGNYSKASEVKAVDTLPAVFGFTRPPAGGSVQLLNGVQTGAAFYNRIGSKIEMKSLHIRGDIYYALTSIQDVVRILVVYDRQPNGATPPLTTILQDRDQSGNISQDGVCEINLDFRERFQIVRDIEVFVPSATVTAGVLTNGPQQVNDTKCFNINEFIKLRGLVTHYGSTANPCTIANINTGALFVYFVGATQDSTVGFRGGFRLRYNDR